MGAKRVRIPCPNCRNRLHIRVEDLGRKGECRYCGHRFRPKVKHTVEQLDTALAPGGRPARRRVIGPERAGASSWPGRAVHPAPHFASSDWAGGVEPPDEELAADLVDGDEIVVGFQDAPARPRPRALAHESVAATPAPGRVGGFAFAGTETEMFQFHGEVPVAGPGTGAGPGPGQTGTGTASAIAEQVVRLVVERDEAQSECARLRGVIEQLRVDLGQQLSEAARLRKSNDKLKAARAERDRLNAERALLVREVTELQSRLVETQVALVEVEDELEEARSRARSERRGWEEQVRAAEDRFAEQRGRSQAGGSPIPPGPGQPQPAATHEFDATLYDLEMAPYATGTSR
jgi:hypothetical protein